jgi:hypothetical protein
MNLYVSVSGFTQGMYQRYHRNGNLAFVKRNLEYAAEYKLKHGIKDAIYVRYLNFGYNADELRLFEEYALGLGLLFEHRHAGGYDGT